MASIPAVPVIKRAPKYGVTSRRDTWWRPQLLTVLGLGSFILYSTWAALQGGDYRFGPYLSPFYSPELLGAEGWFGDFPDWWPGLLASPALLILGGPLTFRTTCYYYRKAYYRSFFADPPACAVQGFKRGYGGETKLFIFQNLHRFAFYIAVGFIVLLTYDAVEAFFFDGAFGIGLGTLIMCANVFFLSLYTFSCHSCRHLVGGSLNSFYKARFGIQRYKLWKIISKINEHHMLYAWCSLISVGVTDIYIRLLATGTISSEPRLFG